jgi:uncharacterized RDD family membrane protein YckC
MSLLYEAVLAGALCFIATALFLALFGDSRAQPMRALLQCYLLLVTGAYFIASWTGGRRTLPMRTWHLRLVDRSGRPPGLAVAAMRFVFALVGIGALGVGIAWMMFDREQLFLHDRLAGTRLVQDS